MKQDANTRLALKLGAGAVAMFGFGYALVPLYDVFCEITGLNGKTGVISEAQASTGTVDTARLVTVQFDANLSTALPWRFSPAQTSMQVHPGEVGMTTFYAENLSDRRVTGQAVPSMAPGEASIYFNKTECFCFTQQVLQPRERREMPVRFVIDPGLPAGVSTVTLSYTFFETS